MIAITFFPSLREPKGARKSSTWRALCSWLSKPVISPVKDDTAGFSLATYAKDYRLLRNVERVFAIGLDLDEGVSLEDLRGKFATTSAFVHTTWSSTIDAPRCRVFLELSRPVTADEYRRVYQATVIIAERGGMVVDRQASDPSRFWFRPSVEAEGRSYIYWTCDGAPIDVEAALRAVPAVVPPAPLEPRERPAGVDCYDRAKAYLDKVSPAISGSGGHNHTFVIASKLVRGFMLSNDDAYRLLCDWNQRCVPPWSERELRRKVDQASKESRHTAGDMLERQR